MFRNYSSKSLSTIVFVLIIIYGFFKIWVCEAYAILIEKLLHFLNLEVKIIIDLLNNYRLSTEYKGYLLGWIIYYPTYFLLHIAFIFLLFRNNIKVRNYLMAGLTILVSLLVLLSIIGKIADIETLYRISYDSFQKLFGLPFILLFIEGGRILYKDIYQNETEL